MAHRLAPVDLAAALSALPELHRDRAGQLQVRLQAPSFVAALELVGLVGASAEHLDHHPDIDLRWRTVTFRLTTHSVGGVTELDIELARQILLHGAAIGAEPLPATNRVEIAVDAADPAAITPFWQVGLGYRIQITDDGGQQLHHPDGTGPVLWFQRMSPPRSERSRLHLDVYVPADQARQRVADTLAAGGRLVTENHAPDWWVLADSEGNELCICV